MKNILVAIDFDEHTMEVVRHGIKLARAFEAKVWIVHIAAPNPDFVGYEPGPKYIRQTRADELRSEHRQVQEMADLAKKEGLEADGLLVDGPTVKMILEEATKLEADLIITGSHDHSFFYNVLVGNTTLELFKESDIPLMAIPLGR